MDQSPVQYCTTVASLGPKLTQRWVQIFRPYLIGCADKQTWQAWCWTTFFTYPDSIHLHPLSLTCLIVGSLSEFHHVDGFLWCLILSHRLRLFQMNKKKQINPANTKHLYNIYAMLAQRRRRWSGVVNVMQMFCVCWEPSTSLIVVIFTPQPLSLWGIVITRGGRPGGQAVRNSAVTKKLNYEFCLFFIDMTCVPGQFIPYIFFWHQAISGHFPRWPLKKLVGTITYEPLVGLRSNLYVCSLGISDDLFDFWDESFKNKMAAAAI